MGANDPLLMLPYSLSSHCDWNYKEKLLNHFCLHLHTGKFIFFEFLKNSLKIFLWIFESFYVKVLLQIFQKIFPIFLIMVLARFAGRLYFSAYVVSANQIQNALSSHSRRLWRFGWWRFTISGTRIDQNNFLEFSRKKFEFQSTDEINVQAYLTLYFNPKAHSYLLSHEKLQNECKFFPLFTKTITHRPNLTFVYE